MTKEEIRLGECQRREKHWKRWGPYLSERAWGTVREDYSPYGTAWEYLPHDHARSRAYRWNEDGLAGICDRHQLVCFALSVWNERDPILKERLFGFHGENAFRLPMPARYIVDQQSVIRSADVSPDYTIRPEPSETAATLEELTKGRA
jgi:hypothetical protein